MHEWQDQLHEGPQWECRGAGVQSSTWCAANCGVLLDSPPASQRLKSGKTEEWELSIYTPWGWVGLLCDGEVVLNRHEWGLNKYTWSASKRDSSSHENMTSKKFWVNVIYSYMFER